MKEPALWVAKYRPKKFTELLFSDETHFKALKWLKNSKRGSVLHITGNPGIGKTSLVHCIARALRYNIIEMGDIKIDNIKEIPTRSHMNNVLNLLLVDEPDITPNILHNLLGVNVPVIIISCNFYSKNVETIKIRRPSNEMILNYTNKVLKMENTSVDSRVILKFIESCNYDFRSVLNYCQLVKSSPKGIKIADRNVFNIFKICSSILNQRMKFNDFESVYSENIANLCLNSVIENSKSSNSLKLFIEFSEISEMKESFQFIFLDKLNETKCNFSYSKYKNPEPIKKDFRLDFFPFYERSLQSHEKIKHLQEIFEKYNIKKLSGIDLEIKNYKDMSFIKKGMFRYKYNQGSSSAPKRDITISEILDI